MLGHQLDGLLIDPPSEGGIAPHVTLSILFDSLGFDALWLNDGEALPHKDLRWFVLFDPHHEENNVVPAIKPSQLLVVSSPSDLDAALAAFPSSCIATYKENDMPDAALLDVRNVLLFAEFGSMLPLVLELQAIFVKSLLWESELDRRFLQQGSLDSLLDASTSMIGNFIFITDTNFNVIAFTHSIEPPDELHSQVIENGCLTQSTMAEKRFRLPEKTFYTRTASALTPFDRVSYPIHINHTYFGSVSMSCNNKPDTQGLRDLFMILVGYVKKECERMWSQRAALDSPSYFFFEKLLQGEPMTESYVESQLESNELPSNGRFKLVVFDVDPSIDPSLTHQVLKASSRLNSGFVKCFPYRHSVLAVCYDEDEEGELSHRKTIFDINEKVYERFGVTSGISSIFSKIEDLDLAYRQAQIALGFKNAIEREKGVNEGQPAKGVYLFEDALLYYLIDPSGKDERFIRFTFSTSLVNRLWQEDKKNDTNYLALLWAYLRSERNATEAAQQLHMHRNTVLYHIEKIQKRFDFDLDEKTVRDWLLLSFKVFFSTQSSESLSSIFSEP